MDPVTAAAIAQGLSALLQIWAQAANKPPGWTPLQDEWDAMLALNTKTALDYKKEAAALLGLPWPPDVIPTPDVPSAPPGN